MDRQNVKDTQLSHLASCKSKSVLIYYDYYLVVCSAAKHLCVAHIWCSQSLSYLMCALKYYCKMHGFIYCLLLHVMTKLTEKDCSQLEYITRVWKRIRESNSGLQESKSK